LIQGFQIHRAGKPLFANQALANMFGYRTPDEILALDSIYQLATPHEFERLGAYGAARLAGHTAPMRHIHQGVRRDGSCIWVESIGRRV
jgi:diguanylate cyclase